MSLSSEVARRILDGPGEARVCLDDWCALDRHSAEFKSMSSATRKWPVGHQFTCNLTCYHNNNYVSATGSGEHTGDAFIAALKQMELTIGSDWRSKGH